MNTVNSLVWLGDHPSAISHLNLLERGSKLAEADPSVMAASYGAANKESRFGDYEEFVQVVGNVAIVPVKGQMMASESWLSRMFGVMAYDTLSNIMAEIVDDGGVNTVVLDVDSPGGDAKGVDIATSAIQAASDAGIKTVTHTSGSMSSAAYWIGSASEVVAASEAAEVGSVGVIGIHMEESERNKKEGLTYTVMRKGEEKALATPYEKLSDKGRAQIEESMDRRYQQFVGAVSDQRGLPKEFVLDKIATGKVFTSLEAQELGMIDEVISYNDLVSRYVESDDSAAAGTNNSNWSEAAMHTKPIINASELSPEEAAIAVAAGANPDDVLPKIAAEQDGDSGDELADVSVIDGDDPAVDASATPGDTDDGDAGDDDAGDGNAAAASELANVQSLMAGLNDQLVASKVEVARLTAKVSELETGNVGLRQIAVEQTQRLRISLGMPGDTLDLEAMSDTALVQAHVQNQKQFLERFNVGAKSQVAKEDNTPAATVTRLQNAALKATSFTQ